jgi:hypothetical protein
MAKLEKGINRGGFKERRNPTVAGCKRFMDFRTLESLLRKTAVSTGEKFADGRHGRDAVANDFD